MKVFLFVLCLLFSIQGLARYETVTSEQLVEEESNKRKARRTAIDKAIEEVSVKKITEMIGEKRFQENSQFIETNVIPLKNRFIPSFKITKSEKKSENQFQFELEIKVSSADLRHILQQKGLFASQQRTGIVFPFIEVNDQMSGASYRWWAPVFSNTKTLEQFSYSLEKEMVQGFMERGLFLIRPQAFSMLHFIPDFLQKTYLTQTEKVQIASLKRAQLFLDGKVDILNSPLRENAYRIRIQLSCKQTANGKRVADIVRSFDTPSGQNVNQVYESVQEMARRSGKDLANQIYDLWSKGTLEAEVIRLAITGSLDHQQILRLKRMIPKKVGGVKGLRERLFEPGRVTFEVDYSGGIEGLQAQLNKAKLDGFISQVVAVNSGEIIFDVKAKN